MNAVGVWCDDVTDLGGRGKAVLVEHRQHLVDGLGGARHQQAATGLWVGQQGLVDGLAGITDLYFMAIGCPVAAGCTGQAALCSQLAHALQQGHVRHRQLHGGVRSARHFERVASQAKTRHIGHRMHAS